MDSHIVEMLDPETGDWIPYRDSGDRERAEADVERFREEAPQLEFRVEPVDVRDKRLAWRAAMQRRLRQAGCAAALAVTVAMPARAEVTMDMLLELTNLADADLQQGDIIAARLRLAMPVEAHIPAALRMAAQTYDPRWLHDHGVIGCLCADPDQSVELYQQAADLGDSAAQKRLAELSDAEQEPQ